MFSGRLFQRLLPLATLGVLLLFAVLFWQERAFFGDASWISFRIINFETLQIQEHRYGSFITQLVPLLAVKAGLPLKAVLFLYSISFNVFYLLAGLLLFRWRQYDFLLLLALYCTVSFSVGFYWTNNEVHQGMAWLLLFLGWAARNKPGNGLFYAVALLLCFLALSSHMLLLLAAGCFWGHLLLAKRAPFYGSRRGVVLGIFTTAVAIWRYYMSKVEGWYDAEKLSFIDQLQFAKIPEAFGGKSSVGFLERWPTHYPMLPLLLALALALLVVQRRWLSLGWHLLSLAAFWFFIGVAFTDFVPWYAESDWASWTVTAVAPLALGRLWEANKRHLTTLLWLLVFGTGLARIYCSATPFEHRLQQVMRLTGLLQSRGAWKTAVLMPDAKALNEKMILSWPLPTEVNALSALKGAIPVVSLGVIADTARLPDTPSTLLIPFGTLKSRQFNKKYFPVDSVQPYTLFPADSLLHWLD